MIYNREAVLEKLFEHVKTDSLRKHCYAVEGAMREYALKMSASADEWGALGLLHDLDYEKFPEKHPHLALEWLAEMQYPPEFIQAVKGHAADSTSERPTPMAKCLYAVDELSSFIVAVALMRPEGFNGMNVKSVTKKLKDKAFAKAVDRDRISMAAQELGVDLQEHIALVITGLQVHQQVLNNRGDTLL